MKPYTLFGAMISLYTGKARSYLIKQHIEFEEQSPGSAYFTENVLPKIGRTIIPVMETPDGELVQDGADIIDWFETRGLARISAYPQTPCQKIVALILELFGGEGMLRPAMHFRWNFDDANGPFLRDQFARALFPGVPDDVRHDRAEKTAQRMQKAGVGFGVVPDTFAMIETAYAELLAALNDHFLAQPYILGGVPCIADYGMIAPLFAHLGRDPYPAQMMKTKAPAVFRWTERMNERNADAPEFTDPPAGLLGGDAVPQTLEPVLHLIAKDYLPEVRAFVAFTNNWLKEQTELPGGSVVGGAPGNRFIGLCEFELRGQKVTAAVVPYRFYLLQRIQDAFDTMSTGQQSDVRGYLKTFGLEDILDLRTTRRIARQNNLEVWA